MRVFICNCSGEIKLPENLDFGPDVEVKVIDNVFSEETKKEIESYIGREKVIVAGPSPRIMEGFFFDPNIRFVNIREQAAWIGHSPEKIRDLIQGMINRLKSSEQIEMKKFRIKSRDVAVIGGGVSGLEAARQIAIAGFKVYLIEKKPFLGGLVAGLDRLYPQGTPNSHVLYPLINEIVRNKNIEIITNALVEDVEGQIGDYRIKIKKRGYVPPGMLSKECEEVCPVSVRDEGVERKAIYFIPTYPYSYGIDFDSCTRCGKCRDICEDISLDEVEETLHVGAIVVATGLKAYDASKIRDYGYGRYPKVLTAWEFERMFSNGLIRPKSVAIIHCAGSRDQNHLPYCSRVCCMLGLKEAKLIKDTTPETDVYVCYIDMRSYGTYEEFYNTVRKTYGVKFIQGRPSEIQQDNGDLIVRVEDILLGKKMDIRVDYVVLLTGFVPDDELFQKLNLPADGRFPTEYVNSSHSVDSNPRGIFIAGSAAFPKGVAETMIDAGDAAKSVINLLGKKYAKKKTPTARINSEICGEIDCRICLTACPYGAVYIRDNKVTVNEELCMGCGICTATCAAGANQLEGYIDKGMTAQVEGMTRKGDIIAFLCKWSSYNAADKAGYERLKYPENVKIVRIPCTGRIDAQMILKAFSCGAKAVLIAGCAPDACHYFTGNFKARKRVLALRELIKQFGIDPEALAIEWIGKDESKKFVEIVNRLNARGA